MDSSIATAVTGVATWLTNIAVVVAVPVCGAAVAYGCLNWIGGGNGGQQTNEGRSMVIRFGLGFLLVLGATAIVGELKTATGF
jgi:hypothetical protein